VEVAVKAALTGHLVFSTLHTNDAPSTVTRMVNMGVEPFLITASLNLVVAQRLVRRICKHCGEKYAPPEEILTSLGITDPNVLFNRGEGCADCSGTGYRGRVALYELLTVTETIRDRVMDGATSTQLKRVAIEEGMKTLRSSGIQKIQDGVTTLEEVMSTTVADDV
ncbi:Flp pilus assembly complex ATPase component TadA, partial [bacterium]|nr:Flp pilus assembly complex ATPase component TadA [bacterium]